MVLLVALAFLGTGCGGFVARRLVQAPNTYPGWLAPEAPVVFDLPAECLTNLPTSRLKVGPPEADLWFRVVEPGHYGWTSQSTNWVEKGKQRFEFTFRFSTPPEPQPASSPIRGTVVLLHGYGVDHASLIPWAFRLAQEGWRCVLVDLRGHGKSTGRQISFGLQEAQDLSQLLDLLQVRGELAHPVVAFGQSYGAAVALRWQAQEPRIHSLILISPYADLAEAALNIRREYAAWIPKSCVRAGLRRLPGLLETPSAELNPITWVQRKTVPAFFAVGDADRITPPTEVRRLEALCQPRSRLVIVPKATHENVAFLLDPLAPPVLEWLQGLGGN